MFVPLSILAFCITATLSCKQIILQCQHNFYCFSIILSCCFHNDLLYIIHSQSFQAEFTLSQDVCIITKFFIFWHFIISLNVLLSSPIFFPYWYSCHCSSTGSSVTVPALARLILFQYTYRLSCHCSSKGSSVTVLAPALRILFQHRLSGHCSSTGSPVTVPAQALLSLFRHRLSCHRSSTGSTFLSVFQHRLSCHCSSTGSHVTVLAPREVFYRCSSADFPVSVLSQALLSLFQHRLSSHCFNHSLSCHCPRKGSTIHNCSSTGFSVTVPANNRYLIFLKLYCDGPRSFHIRFQGLIHRSFAPFILISCPFISVLTLFPCTIMVI